MLHAKPDDEHCCAQHLTATAWPAQLTIADAQAQALAAEMPEEDRPAGADRDQLQTSHTRLVSASAQLRNRR
jgi:hypothetical protein